MTEDKPSSKLVLKMLTQSKLKYSHLSLVAQLALHSTDSSNVCSGHTEHSYGCPSWLLQNAKPSSSSSLSCTVAAATVAAAIALSHFTHRRVRRACIREGYSVHLLPHALPPVHCPQRHHIGAKDEGEALPNERQRHIHERHLRGGQGAPDWRYGSNTQFSGNCRQCAAAHGVSRMETTQI